MSYSDAAKCSDKLRRHITWDFSPWQSALRSVGQRDGRIEMRPGDRGEGENERDQHCAGCERVCKQRNGYVSTGKAFAHDAGANDRREQQRCTDRLSGHAPRQCHAPGRQKQHPGAQQFAGFVARMKALINLPSTAGAIASTSIPCPVRNVLASSMLYTRVGSISTLSKPAWASFDLYSLSCKAPAMQP